MGQVQTVALHMYLAAESGHLADGKARRDNRLDGNSSSETFGSGAVVARGWS